MGFVKVNDSLQWWSHPRIYRMVENRKAAAWYANALYNWTTIVAAALPKCPKGGIPARTWCAESSNNGCRPSPCNSTCGFPASPLAYFDSVYSRSIPQQDITTLCTIIFSRYLWRCSAQRAIRLTLDRETNSRLRWRSTWKKTGVCTSKWVARADIHHRDDHLLICSKSCRNTFRALCPVMGIKHESKMAYNTRPTQKARGTHFPFFLGCFELPSFVLDQGWLGMGKMGCRVLGITQDDWE